MHPRLLSPLLLVLCACRPGAFDVLSAEYRSDLETAPDGSVAEPIVDAASAEPDARAPEPTCDEDLTQSLDHCGACNAHCVETTSGSVAACVDSSCVQHVATLSSPSTSALHGNASGGASFVRPCASDQVLLGIHGEFGAEKTVSVGTHCGKVPLVRSSDGFIASVVHVESHEATSTNLTDDWDLKPYDLRCPEGKIVVQLAGATHYFSPSDTGVSVAALAIVCAELGVRGEQLTLTPESEPSVAGALEGEDRMSFAEPCPEGAVATGVTGRSGAYLDAVALSCATLAVETRKAAVEER